MKNSQNVRNEFLDFFQQRNHTIVPSAPVIPQNDPTLYFTNAGMNQFKDVFLATGSRPYTRAANTQKCIRASGKHNDLDDVGVDTYHHTFFEMLGNWSFGDYFKEEAIQWAWELLTKEWKLPPSKLYATTFAGDKKLNLQPDQESHQIWLKKIQLPPSHILSFGTKENFWEMGDTGPCGPCTEIHLDRGPKACDKQNQRQHQCKINGNCARFIEIWNLVFIQFNRTPQELKPLPQKHVDTGMGFERILAVLQNKISNYDTDIFSPLFQTISSLVNQTYGKDKNVDIAFRVIADHIRALAFSFADGALPSNTGRGYVLRRILRRASRFGRQILKTQQPFLYKLVPTLAQIYAPIFPEIQQRQNHIQLLIQSEEETFERTLDKGLQLYEKIVQDIKNQQKTTIDGKLAYDLYSTYGFPKDLIELMAKEDQLQLDEKGWQLAQKEHKQKSEGKHSYDFNLQEIEGLPPTQFTGYSYKKQGRKIYTKLLKLIGTQRLVLEKTPFYPESGGQIGDSGYIWNKNFKFRVEDTQKYGEIIVHIGYLQKGDLSQLPKKVYAQIDEERRQNIMANHTATHLLHWALKQLFGPEANQAGSLVAAEKLRFDVTLPRKIKPEEIQQLENLINQKIQENLPVKTTIENLEDAKKRGATALFGEKYEQTVRVVQIQNFSIELCGGTHCQSTGQIGAFVITSESALQTGVRRIEAQTRLHAIQYLQKLRSQQQKITQLLHIPPEDILPRLEKLLEENKQLKKKSQENTQKQIPILAKSLLQQAKKYQHAHIILQKIDNSNPKELQSIADHLVALPKPVVGTLATTKNGKAQLVSFISKSLISPKLDANQLIQHITPLIGGKGGGRPDRGQGGGNQPQNLNLALQKALEFIQKNLD